MTRNLIKLNMTLTMVTAGKTRIQKHLHFPRFHRIEFDLKSHVFFSTSLKGFSTSKHDVVNWIVSKFGGEFGGNLLGIFWDFFGNFLGIFCRIFWEQFFGRNFLGGIF